MSAERQNYQVSKFPTSLDSCREHHILLFELIHASLYSACYNSMAVQKTLLGMI